MGPQPINVTRLATPLPRSLVRAVMATVVLIQVGWLLLPWHLNRLDEPYRYFERQTALQAWIEHPSIKTRAAWEAENRQLTNWIITRGVATVTLFVLIDAVGFRWLRRRTERLPGPD